MNKKWLFIVNATAGRGKTGRKVNKLMHSLNEHNIDFEIELTKAPMHATDLAFDAVKNGFQKIVAVGGDGTLNEVINGIMKSGSPESVHLGLIPEGGGNDFARNFKLSNNIDKTIEMLKKEKTINIDVGKIEDKYFVNALGIGFDARVAQISSKIKYLNGLPRYLVAVLHALINMKKFSARIELDNCKIEKPFLLLSIGNGLSTGGGFLLTPQARVNDGLLDICFIEKVSRKRLLRLLPHAINGQHLKEPEVIIHQSRKIKISSDQVLPIYFDGELPTLKDPHNIEIELLPARISFIIN